MRTHMPHERTRIDIGDGNHAVVVQIVVQRIATGRPAGRIGAGPHNEARRLGGDGLVFGIIGTVVADVRIRHHHQLSVVRRVGQDFLVACHAGVEAQFTTGGPTLSKRMSVHHRAISKSKRSG